MGLIKKKSRDKLKNKKHKRKDIKTNMENKYLKFKKYNKTKDNSNKPIKTQSRNLLETIENENKNKYFFKKEQKKMPISMLNGIRNKQRKRIADKNDFNYKSGILYDSSQNKDVNNLFLSSKNKKKNNRSNTNFKNSKDAKFKDGELTLDPKMFT